MVRGLREAEVGLHVILKPEGEKGEEEIERGRGKRERERGHTPHRQTGTDRDSPSFVETQSITST